jgi:hypothetical protein
MSTTRFTMIILMYTLLHLRLSKAVMYNSLQRDRPRHLKDHRPSTNLGFQHPVSSSLIFL